MGILGGTRRRLFVRWALLNAGLASFLAASYALYGSHVTGASLAAVPLILLLYAGASAHGGRLCWRADDRARLFAGYPIGTAVDRDRLFCATVAHDAEWLNRWAYTCQIAGIMCTMVGFYVILNSGAGGDLSTKIRGGSVALLGSFIGVLCSLVLLAQHWLIEHDIG